MTDNNSPSRDSWSKLEIIAKLVGDLVLVALTLVIANGTHKISTALQTGELTQQLLSDLASADSTSALRHEIALAALNYTVWDQNPSLVWEVCERIVSNSDYKVVDRTYAFNILRERDSTQALNILRSLTPVTAAIVSEREP